MKLFTNLFIIASLLTVACGPTKNDPLENYKHLNLSKDAQSAPQKVKVVEVNSTTEVPVIVTEYVNTETKVPVIIEKPVPFATQADVEKFKQIFVEGPVYEVKSFSDVGLLKEEALIFIEGKTATYYLQTSILAKGCTADFNVSIEDLPGDVSVSDPIKKENSIVYKITWTPKNVLQNNSNEEKAPFKVTIQEDLKFSCTDETNNKIAKTTFDALTKTTEKEVIVKKEIAKSTNSATGQTTSKATTTVADPDKNSGRR